MIRCTQYNKGECRLVTKATGRAVRVPGQEHVCRQCMTEGVNGFSPDGHHTPCVIDMIASAPAVQQALPTVQYNSGIGTEVERLLKADGFRESSGCSCASLRRELDSIAPDVVEARVEKYGRKLIDNYHKAGGWEAYSKQVTLKAAVRQAATAVAGLVRGQSPALAVACGYLRRACAKARGRGPFDDRITVGVTAFERPEHLRLFLRSLWTAHPSARVIVGDNGRQHVDAAQVAAECGVNPAQCEYLRLPFECGLSAARNAIAARVATEFMLLCEDDFVIDERANIGALVDVLDSDPAIGVCGTDHEQGYRGKRVHGAYRFPREELQPALQVARGGTRFGLCDWTMNFALYRTAMLREVQWPPALKVGEHVAFFRDVAAHGRWRVAWTPDAQIGHIGDSLDPPDFRRYRDRALVFAMHDQAQRDGLPPLLPDSAFARIFEPLRGLRVGIVDAGGNAGDRLIHEAERQLCVRFGVDWVTFDPLRQKPDGLDKLLIFGGGNMGTPYEAGRRIRTAALDSGVPCWLLPQSWWQAESIDRYERAFARDRLSADFSGAELAPDMALAWACPDRFDEPVHDAGLFLRDDIESVFAIDGKRDPIVEAKSPRSYVALASKYAHVVTDRLHFAIAALIARREVTLLPNAYRKNRGLWETWLRDLGCRWSDTPPTPAHDRTP